MNGGFSIRLAGPALWEREMARALADLDPAEQRYALGIVSTLHGRHFGISSRLAASLARVLVSPRLPAQGVWGAVGGCLMRHWNPESQGQLNRMGISPGQGLFLAANPVYTVLHLAGPLIDLACRKIGRSILFCRDPVRPPLSCETYSRYQDELDQAVDELAAGEQMAGFWLNVAGGMAAFSRLGGKPTSGSLPSVDPTAQALLLRLQTRPPAPAPDLNHRKRADSPLSHRPTRDRHEGGLAGIQLSRRPEDIHNLLLSEFLNPKPLLADRLVNTGFLVHQRKPKLEKRRDVFMAAVLPPETCSELTVDFLKACWFEAVVHLSLLLRRYGFDRSEFRWIEGNPLGNRTDHGFLLEDLPPIPPGFAAADAAGFRWRFLRALGWLPGFLDRRPCNGPVVMAPDAISPQAGFSRETVLDWVAWAWKGQREHVPLPRGAGGFASETSESGVDRLPWTQFSCLHLMVFLPSPAESGAPVPHLDGLRHRLGLARDAGFQLSITWLPRRLHGRGSWGYQAEGRNRWRLFDNDPPTSEKSLAEGLIQPWFHQWTKEIWGV